MGTSKIRVRSQNVVLALGVCLVLPLSLIFGLEYSSTRLSADLWRGLLVGLPVLNLIGIGLYLRRRLGFTKALHSLDPGDYLTAVGTLILSPELLRSALGVERPETGSILLYLLLAPLAVLLPVAVIGLAVNIEGELSAARWRGFRAAAPWYGRSSVLAAGLLSMGILAAWQSRGGAWAAFIVFIASPPLARECHQSKTWRIPVFALAVAAVLYLASRAIL